jgi:NAD+ synthase (glutamine-hydrolysing)
MYEKLLHVWGNELSPREIYEKVRHFSFYYGQSRISVDPSKYAETNLLTILQPLTATR